MQIGAILFDSLAEIQQMLRSVANGLRQHSKGHCWTACGCAPCYSARRADDAAEQLTPHVYEEQRNRT